MTRSELLELLAARVAALYRRSPTARIMLRALAPILACLEETPL